MLAIQPRQRRLRLTTVGDLVTGMVRQRQKHARVRGADKINFAGLLRGARRRTRGSSRACRSAATGRLGPAALLEQTWSTSEREPLEHADLIDSRLARLGYRATHALGRVERKVTGERAQPAEQPLLWLGEQLITPVDGAAQRLLADGAVVGATRQQLQPLADARKQRRWRQDTHACRGQFDGQGQAVQAHADLGDGGKVELRGVKAVVRRPRPLEEQRHCLVLDQRLRRGQQRQVGERERVDGEDVLAVHTQRRAAGDQQLQAGRDLQQGSDFRGGGYHVLEVVEHERQLRIAQEGHQRGRQLLVGALFEAERCGATAGTHQRRIRSRSRARPATLRRESGPASWRRRAAPVGSYRCRSARSVSACRRRAGAAGREGCCLRLAAHQRRERRGQIVVALAEANRRHCRLHTPRAYRTG